MTLYLNQPRWLSIDYYLLIKYNLLTYKAINLTQPQYLSYFIESSGPTWVTAFLCPQEDTVKAWEYAVLS